MADKKKYVPESQDVTEPLPGMLDPISQAKADKKAQQDRADKATKQAKVYHEALSKMYADPQVSRESRSNMFKNFGAAADKASRERYKMDIGQYDEYSKGGSVKSSASKRADGCAQRGKTKGKIV